MRSFLSVTNNNLNIFSPKWRPSNFVIDNIGYMNFIHRSPNVQSSLIKESYYD